MSRLHGPPDAGLILQAQTTQTTPGSSAAFNLGSGFTPGGAGQPMGAVVPVTALDLTSGNESYSFSLEESADGSTGWTGISRVVTVSATGQVLVKGFVTQPFVRLVWIAAGTTPSITFSASLAPLGKA